MRCKTLVNHVRTNAYSGRTFPESLGSTMDQPLLNASPALNDNGYIGAAR
jgi:hypothetical protein